MNRIEINAARYHKLFCHVADEEMAKLTPNIAEQDMQLDTYDVLLRQRKMNLENRERREQEINLKGTNLRQMVPKELERRYQLFLVPGANSKKNITKLREIKG